MHIAADAPKLCRRHETGLFFPAFRTARVLALQRACIPETIVLHVRVEHTHSAPETPICRIAALCPAQRAKGFIQDAAHGGRLRHYEKFYCILRDLPHDHHGFRGVHLARFWDIPRETVPPAPPGAPARSVRPCGGVLLIWLLPYRSTPFCVLHWQWLLFYLLPPLEGTVSSDRSGRGRCFPRPHRWEACHPTVHLRR